MKQLQERRAVYRRYDYRKSKRVVKDKLVRAAPEHWRHRYGTNLCAMAALTAG